MICDIETFFSLYSDQKFIAMRDCAMCVFQSVTILHGCDRRYPISSSIAKYGDLERNRLCLQPSSSSSTFESHRHIRGWSRRPIDTPRRPFGHFSPRFNGKRRPYSRRPRVSIFFPLSLFLSLRFSLFFLRIYIHRHTLHNTCNTCMYTYDYTMYCTVVWRIPHTLCYRSIYRPTFTVFTCL